MNNTYTTTDIVLAAALRLHGVDMIGIEKTGTKGTFIFDGHPTEWIDKYDMGMMKVEPRQFNDMIKALTTTVRRALI